MEKDKKVRVINRNNGFTGYQIPETGVSRNFAPREEKQISLGELKQLSYIPGGAYLIQNCLIIDSLEALDELNLLVEPEYFYTEDKIRSILFDGSLDQLEDTLNFAPSGVIELVKKIAVDEEVPDVRKRLMISEKTGFNITSAINVNHAMKDENSAEVDKENTRLIRKTKKPTIERKAEKPETNNYKVVATTK